MTISTTRRFLIFQFLDTPMAEREMSHAEFRKKHRISAKIWRNLLADYVLNQKETAQRQKLELKARAQMEKEMYGMLPPEYDSKAFLKSRSRDVDEALIEACKKGNANALKVYKQILGELTEKTEVKVEVAIDPDTIARIHSANQQWLREQGYLGNPGMGQVQSKPVLLPENICENTGQTQGDNPV